MNFQISHWVHRFGNHVVQLLNGAKICLRENNYFKSLPHQYFDCIEVNKHLYKKNTYLFKEIFFELSNNTFDSDAFSISKEYLIPKFKIKPLLKTFNENTLHIHIRSGDIFNDIGHRDYIQNPLCFFKYCISKYRHSIIISEDDNNPLINYLSKEPSVELKIGRSLEEDIQELISAKNLCFSGYGTFLPSIVTLSQNVKKIHITNLSPKITCDHIDIDYIEIDLNKYIKPGNWKNSIDQKLLMVNYVCDNTIIDPMDSVFDI